MRALVVASLSLVVTVAGSGHAKAPGAAAQPSFRTGTTLVEVSAVVTHDGRPVTDLRVEDFAVLDNGKPQPIVAFERVDLGRGERPEQRRDFVLVLDDMHVAPASTAFAAGAARAFVAALGPHDRLAVVNTGPHELRLDLTTDRGEAMALIDRFVGQAPSPQSIGPLEAELRARSAMQVLQQVAASLRGDAQERRAILLVSEGHPSFVPEGRADLSAAAYASLQDYYEVLRQAAIGNVAIYTVDPRGLRGNGTGLASVPSRSMLPLATEPRQISENDAFGSLALLARNTGGLQTLWTNDLTKVFPQMLEDSRQYYRIAYAQPDPAPGKKQPAQRTIKVKVARPGVAVRARERYAPASVS